MHIRINDIKDHAAMLQLAESKLRESIEVKKRLLGNVEEILVSMARELVRVFQIKGRFFLMGNGGSAADAQHIAAELVNRFERDRPPLPALALTVDTSIISSIGNDFSFDDIFLKQLQALGREGDVVLGISTSGRSSNVIKALQWAHGRGLKTWGWMGEEVTVMDAYCHGVIHVPSKVTARIQECHITLAHILCALVDEIMFAGAPSGSACG